MYLSMHTRHGFIVHAFEHEVLFFLANHEITLDLLDLKLVHCFTYTCCLGAHLSSLSDQETRLQARARSTTQGILVLPLTIFP